ncbi:substrate-binding domain-containing protein [Rhizobiaceae bacterium]|nr:substrate-binding domain-containing protein [Rhizobiaceae bacterium]
MIRLLTAALLTLLSAHASASEMRLAVTTSFHNSGLADVLLPAIRRDLGLDVQLLVVGSGQALRLARAGDVDAVLAHARAAEEALVRDGHATHRRPIMANHFVLVGPVADPAGLKQASDAKDAFRWIAQARAPFVSRGDDSGTHRKEMALWADASVVPEGAWYRSVGSGMGAALNTAAAMDATILSDRATWLTFKNPRGLAILFEGDPALLNQYAYLPVNPALHPHVKAAEAQALEDWLAGPRGQSAIGAYRLEGVPLFTPNATPR